jgi:hypothetical protein
VFYVLRQNYKLSTLKFFGFSDFSGAISKVSLRWFFGLIFKLRLLAWRKLRLSSVAVCVLGCFFGSAFEGFCGLRLLFGRVATFHVDAMLPLLSVLGARFFGGVCFRVLRFWVCVLGRLVLRGCAVASNLKGRCRF